MIINIRVIIMTEKKGHFEKGIWVEDAAAAAPAAMQEPQIDIRLAAATRGVITAMDELAKVTRDLVTTDEGKKHIEKTVKDTTAHVQKSFDEIMIQAKTELEKAKADVKAEVEKAKQKK